MDRSHVTLQIFYEGYGKSVRRLQMMRPNLLLQHLLIYIVSHEVYSSVLRPLLLHLGFIFLHSTIGERHAKFMPPSFADRRQDARNLPPLLEERLLCRGEAGPRKELAQTLLRLR